MKIKVGVMGSAGEIESNRRGEFQNRLRDLARALVSRKVVLLTGATTGLIYDVGKAARDAGIQHVGISPASSETEHTSQFQLPTDACDLLIYTGFGLKGRNVVLVRSCDIVLFIAGAMGSLNEFTIAHDEGKVIGCLTGTGGVADEADYLLERFGKETGARILQNGNAEELIELCIQALKK